MNVGNSMNVLKYCRQSKESYNREVVNRFRFAKSLRTVYNLPNSV